MPAWNESDRLLATIHSIAETRSMDVELEVVIVDDASTDGCCSNLIEEVSASTIPGLSVKVVRLHERVGVYRTRNQGAAHASGEILFITDAHVRFCKNWDRYVFDHIQKDRILAATITDEVSGFKGYGCNLMVPFMGTRWNLALPAELARVQIAACPGTVLYKELFQRIGGYDEGMILYAAGEPEFSVRAWLSGAEIVSVPALEVLHRFKQKDERRQFLDGMRPFMIHNRLRFGLLYLNDLAILQMIRHFATIYSEQAQEAFSMVENSDVWQRRDFLENSLVHPFAWFIDQFKLKNQVGQEIPT